MLETRLRGVIEGVGCIGDGFVGLFGGLWSTWIMNGHLRMSTVEATGKCYYCVASIVDEEVVNDYLARTVPLIGRSYSLA